MSVTDMQILAWLVLDRPPPELLRQIITLDSLLISWQDNAVKLQSTPDLQLVSVVAELAARCV